MITPAQRAEMDGEHGPSRLGTVRRPRRRARVGKRPGRSCRPADANPPNATRIHEPRRGTHRTPARHPDKWTWGSSRSHRTRHRRRRDGDRRPRFIDQSRDTSNRPGRTLVYDNLRSAATERRGDPRLSSRADVRPPDPARRTRIRRRTLIAARIRDDLNHRFDGRRATVDRRRATRIRLENHREPTHDRPTVAHTHATRRTERPPRKSDPRRVPNERLAEAPRRYDPTKPRIAQAERR